MPFQISCVSFPVKSPRLVSSSFPQQLCDTGDSRPQQLPWLFRPLEYYKGHQRKKGLNNAPRIPSSQSKGLKTLNKQGLSPAKPCHHSGTTLPIPTELWEPHVHSPCRRDIPSPRKQLCRGAGYWQSWGQHQQLRAQPGLLTWQAPQPGNEQGNLEAAKGFAEPSEPTAKDHAVSILKTKTWRPCSQDPQQNPRKNKKEKSKWKREFRMDGCHERVFREEPQMAVRWRWGECWAHSEGMPILRIVSGERSANGRGHCLCSPPASAVRLGWLYHTSANFFCTGPKSKHFRRFCLFVCLSLLYNSLKI